MAQGIFLFTGKKSDILTYVLTQLAFHLEEKKVGLFPTTSKINSRWVKDVSVKKNTNLKENVGHNMCNLVLWGGLLNQPGNLRCCIRKKRK